MSAGELVAWVSLALPLPAACLLARRAVGRRSPALLVVYASVLYAALLVVPLHAEAALELAGVLERMTLAGPAVAAGGVLIWGRIRLRSKPEASRGSGPGRTATFDAGWIPVRLRWALVLMGGLYAFFALERLTGYPTTWDSVAYHLPVAAQWLREGSLAIGPEAHFYEAITWNGDLLAMLAMSTGWPALGELWNVTSAVILLSGAHLLARALGVDRQGALVSALLVAGMPMVVFQTFSAYVDLLVAAGLVAAIAMASSQYACAPAPEERERTSALLVGCGLAVGLAVGTKPTAWPLALVVVAVIVIRSWRTRERSERRLVLAALFLAAVAAPCAFWFARNLLATGNPAFPMEISVLGHRIFDGTSPAAVTYDRSNLDFGADLAHWLTFPWTDAGKGGGYPFGVDGGHGPLFAGLVLPGLLYLVWSLRRWRGLPDATRRRWRLRAAMIGLLAAFWVIWWFVLTPVWRFGLPGIALACVLAGPFVADFNRVFPRLFSGVLLTSVAVFGAVAALPRAADLAHRVRHGEWSWSEHYHLPPEIRRIPVDATVVVYDGPREGWNNLALAGPDLSRRLVPHWQARSLAAEGRRPWRCGSYVVDRRPFQLSPDSTPDPPPSLRFIAETVGSHGETTWRIWRADRGGCRFR